jgi:transposase
MIPIPSGVRVWIATGHTDMRRGMQSLALTVQGSLKRDPHGLVRGGVSRTPIQSGLIRGGNVSAYQIKPLAKRNGRIIWERYIVF